MMAMYRHAECELHKPEVGWWVYSALLVNTPQYVDQKIQHYLGVC